MKKDVVNSRENMQQPTVKMAIADCVPVICFAASMVLILLFYHSLIFLAGAIVCVLAGLGKAVWKLIMARSNRNLSILDRQFRYLLSAGFILMVISFIAARPSLSVIWKNLTSFPDNILFLIAMICFVLMGILAARIGTDKKKANRLEQTINLAAQICILLGVIIIWYASDSYKADEEALKYLSGTDSVHVTEIKNGIFFDGLGTEDALIFYPGAKVEYISYAPLMTELAENGIDCFLIEMPYNLAVFGINQADSILSNYNYDRWYLAGHSLGGAMSASYAAKHRDDLNGCIMLAAYPTKNLGDLPMLSVYGSEDGVLNMDKVKEGREYAVNYTEICIEGGNHAGFGSYGAQSGDRSATITGEEQRRQTVDAIEQMIESLPAE